MVRFLMPGLLISALTLATAQEQAEPAKKSNVPSSFHPYNVTQRIDPEPEPMEQNGPSRPKERVTKGKYHCLVTAYDLDPVVMLVARNLDDNDAFRELLKKLDAAVSRHRPARLRCFVVGLYDDLSDVLKQDDKRDELAARLEKMAEDLNLKGVVLTLASPSDLAKYGLDETAALNVILYRQLKIVQVTQFSRDQLDKPDSPELNAVIKAVDAMVPARR
ncbi:MAG: hypothetical protein SNJ82_11885 [Gemmataceae bacterium]